MPYRIVVLLVYIQDPKKGIATFELEDQKVTGLKPLEHTCEISIKLKGHSKIVGMDQKLMLDVAIEEARVGLAEGGIPIGAALFDREGKLLGRGHNRRVQENDPSIHGETDAFRKAGRQTSYKHTVMVTTLAPCWYCSGLRSEE